MATLIPNDFPSLIADLYRIVDRLELHFGRKFTPDGHLVGSIGEVVAAHCYDLNLAAQAAEAIDAWTRDTLPRSVQIKLTARGTVSISDSDIIPDILIVLKFERRVGFKEVYNGIYPGEVLRAIKSTKRNVKTISLSRLSEEQKHVSRCLEDHGRIMALNFKFGESGS